MSGHEIIRKSAAERGVAKEELLKPNMEAKSKESVKKTWKQYGVANLNCQRL